MLVLLLRTVHRLMFLQADSERRRPKRSSRAGCGAMPPHGITASIPVEEKRGGFSLVFPLPLPVPRPRSGCRPQLCSRSPVGVLARGFQPRGEAELTEKQQYAQGEDLLPGPCLQPGLDLISTPWGCSGSAPKPCGSGKLQEPWSKGIPAQLRRMV